MRVVTRRRVCACISVVLAAGCSATRALAQPDDLAAIIRTFATLAQPADWHGLEQLPEIRWAKSGPVSLPNCAPDGHCYAQQGALSLGGRRLTVLATGARTMVFNVYLRNTGAPLGADATLRALHAINISVTPARCPVRGSRGTTTWFRLGGAGLLPVHLAVQPPNPRGVGEGFVLSAGAELPMLQPNQLSLYSERCEAGAAQRPVATVRPHEAIAAMVVTLLVPSSAALHEWAGVAALPTGITWSGPGPVRGDLSYRGDRNPYNRTGTVRVGGRAFSVLASGTQRQVQVVYLDEMQMHPRGEHTLGVVYQQGIAVQLTRCGPVYTESTNNWYALTSGRTQPAMLRQSIRHDGNQVQDAYELRLDGSLPAREPRDRNPGANGCR
jgi:hypothetical protein